MSRDRGDRGFGPGPGRPGGGGGYGGQGGPPKRPGGGPQPGSRPGPRQGPPQGQGPRPGQGPGTHGRGRDDDERQPEWLAKGGRPPQDSGPRGSRDSQARHRAGIQPPLDVLVFDLDEVLVDTSRSYREAVIRTVNDYLEQLLQIPRGDATRGFCDEGDVALLKAAGGFNNDWDLSYGLIRYALSLLAERIEESGFLDVEGLDTFDALRERAPIRETVADLLARKDTRTLAMSVRDRGGGPKVLSRLLGGKNRWLVLYEGDVTMGNIVKRLFQEHYLGDALFSECYRRHRCLVEGPGLIDLEEPLISPEALAALQRSCALAIATGRPFDEAQYALDRFGMAPFFSSLVTLDEVREAEAAAGYGAQSVSLSKPHPFVIIEAIRKVIGREGLSDRVRCGYVGDLPDDMVAANRAQEFFDVVAIARVQPGGPDPAILREAGATHFVRATDELVPLVAGQ